MQNVEAAGLGIGDDYPPRIMGVLNVSAESPYKPSVFDDPGQAAAYTDEQLIGEGADIVDVGLESANKRFEVLSAEEELARLDTALEAIESVSGDAVFSIETRYHEVASAALDGGFDMVNDICGFADPELPRVCDQHDAAVVKMASPPDLERPGAVESVEEIYEALSRNGLTEKTIVDPAFGGWSAEKTLADDRETFERLREFRGLGQPILVSINRKNFLREFADRSTEDALPVSLAATAMAVERGAHVVRTHDVAETRDAAIIGRAFTQNRLRNEATGVEELDVQTPSELRRHFDRIDAETADPDAGVMRAFELSGLTPEDRDHLSTVAAEYGVTFVSGQQETAGILLGTPAALVAIADMNDHPPTIARQLDTIAARTEA
ncbi:dihydropteroate synthase [Halocatena pleomorpha]|uniref:Dihydropteroate synthase n=1 Tax=Halocatena pleomorpha TaxID=1785090 RepID=A0A3P3R7N1_9EURY|nr:dihydropteroate synthase [Halocatena pleomorpha]RRJ29028.1 dihydropteroate synthase [Halocatena pleomorpha]